MPPTLYEQLTAQRAQRYAQNEADDSYLQLAPNAGAGIGAGLLSGFSSRLQQRRLESQLQLEDSKNQAREFIKSIPINEHNFPIALRLMTEIDSVKPSKMSFLDMFTKAPDPNEQAMARIYGLLKTAIPQDSNQGFAASQTFTPSQQQELGVPAQVSGTIAPDPTKFQYPSEGFKTIPGAGLVHSAQTKTSHILGYDKTGNIITKDLGQDFTTPAERAAANRLEAQKELMADRAAMKQAAEMSEMSQEALGIYITPRQVIEMQVNDPERWQRLAEIFSSRKIQMEKLKTENIQSNIDKNKAIAAGAAAVPPAVKAESANLTIEGKKLGLEGKKLENDKKRREAQGLPTKPGELTDVDRAELRVIEQDLDRQKKLAEGMQVNGLYPSRAAQAAAQKKVQELELKRQAILRRSGGGKPQDKLDSVLDNVLNKLKK